MSGIVVSNVLEKGAKATTNFRREQFSFQNAREGFRALLVALDLKPGDPILLPAYIGWSAREGSGVFDPLEELQLRPIFYRLGCDLVIDGEDVRLKLFCEKPRVLLLIHYFGFPDPAAETLARAARQCGTFVIEDEAHAMLSDLVGGACGRWGHAALFSLHKLLPYPNGGTVLLNDAALPALAPDPDCSNDSLWAYDLLRIAERRRGNASFLLDRLSRLSGRITPLFRQLPDGVVPQTLPVIVHHRSRNELYFEMNDAGFGVVSLYHTMIDRLASDIFPESHELASKILNLPVHQDATEEQLAAMMDWLQRYA